MRLELGAVGAVHCPPRQEQHQAYEMPPRSGARSDHRGRAVDLWCGFGLLAQLLLVVGGRVTHAVAVDAIPAEVSPKDRLLLARPREGR